MAQNVTIAGASYQNVPSIEMPKTGGGTAVFVDTSDANAAAGDITKGKIAYVDGTKITGTLEAAGGKLQAKTLYGTGTYTPDEGYDGFSQVEVAIQGLNGITDDKLRFGTNLWNGSIEHEGRYVGTYNYTFKDIITPPPTESISSGKIVLPPFVPCNLIRKIEASGSPSALYDMPFTELRYQATDTDISSFRLFVTYGNNTNLYLIGLWAKKSDGTYKLQQVMDGGFSRTLLFFEPPALASDTTPLAKWLRASVNSNCGWEGYTPDMPLSYLSNEEITITKNGTTTVRPVLRRKHADGKPTNKTVYSDGFESVTVNVDVPVPSVQDTKALTITSNGTVSVTPDAPYDALKKVDVTVNVASGGGGGAPSLQSKFVTYTENGTSTITPDEGYDGLSSVNVTVEVAGEVALPIMYTNRTKKAVTAQIQNKKYILKAGIKPEIPLGGGLQLPPSRLLNDCKIMLEVGCIVAFRLTASAIIIDIHDSK